MSPRGTVYLLCFNKPFKHARHYLGWTEDLPSRLERHASGNGAKIVAAAQAAGVGWTLVRTWLDKTRYFERKLKSQNNGPRLCPRCKIGFTWPQR